MSTWVARGFVPDSDDEESQESNEVTKTQLEEGQEVDPNVDGVDIVTEQSSLVPPPACASETPSFSSSLHPARESPGSRGLHVSVIIPSNERDQAIHTVSRTAEERHDDSDALSSALSDPLSDVERESVIAAGHETGPAESADPVDGEPYDIDIHEQALTESRSGRTFRLRKAIQLHPYLLEGERYRAILKGRGVKPIRVETQPHERHRGSQYEATQDGSFEGLVQAASISSPPNQLRVPSLSPTREEGLASGSDRFKLPRDLDLGREGQDDSGDAHGSLVRVVDGGVQYGRKRRKIAAAPAISQRPISSKIIVEDMTMFDVPPSPPSSHSSAMTPTVESNVDPVPATRVSTSPKLLPTPITSSGARRPLRRIIDSDDESGPPQRSTQRQMIRAPSKANMATPIPIESGSECGSDSSASETVRSAELQRMRRKIRGVLPASWLTIDQQARKPDSAAAKSRQSVRMVDESVSVKGVAQRVSRRSTARSHQLAAPDIQHSILEVSDDSGTLEDEPQTPTVIERTKSPIHPLFQRPPSLRDETQDIPEDNRIDNMLPPASRRHNARRQRKRQSSLKDAFLHQSRGSEMSDKSSSGLRKSLLGSSLHNDSTLPRKGSKIEPRRKQKTGPRLSIVDVMTASAPMQSDSVPRFLRVAARRARQQPDQGKHSPTGKHIRLQTSNDTEDALASLRAWREGTIQPISGGPRITPRPQRPPLQPRHDNQQQRLPSPTKIVSSNARELRHVHPSKAPVLRVRQDRLKTVLLPRQGVPAHEHSLDDDVSSPARQRPRVFRDPVYRTAQLESSDWQLSPSHHSAVLQRLMARTSHSVKSVADLAPTSAHQKPCLSGDGAMHLPSAGSDTVVARPSKETMQAAPIRQKRRKVPKKRLARRVDVEIRAYRQPSEVILIQNLDEQSQEVNLGYKPVLEGLGTFGTRYTTDFDISALHKDTYFHESTFVGSGLLAKALKTAGRDMQAPAHLHTFSLAGRSYRWGPWMEDVASDVEALLSQSANTTNDNLGFPPSRRLLVLEHLIQYLSLSITFLDPGDEESFVRRTSPMIIGQIDSFTELLEKAKEGTTISATTSPYVLRGCTRCVVLASQILRIGRIQSTDESELTTSLTGITRAILSFVIRAGFPCIRSFLDDNKRHAIRERGIRSEDVFVETVVIVSRVMQAVSLSGSGLWEIVTEELSRPIADARFLTIFERIWYNVFTLLPLLDFDDFGLLKAGRHISSPQDGSALIKQLLSRTFSLISTCATTRSSSTNDYIRACMCRCHRLVNHWGWQRCEPMLGAIFDFFANNGLAQLRHEDSNGSASFLELLDEEPNLAVQPDDRAFTIFLKTLASGLQGMRNVYSDKKIQGIAWRFIPNHGRTHRKDQAVKQSDLDALRNHHDLLCVLYWASPAGFRPRLTTIRNLVDYSTSHREACQLNVRAWSNLARYQISTKEAAATFKPFIAWLQDIVLQTTKQYQYARSEAEKQYEEAQHMGFALVTVDVLQRTIRNNQAQVLVTLRDIVGGVRGAVVAAKNLQLASGLIQDAGLQEIFSLFDAKASSQVSLFIEALGVVRVHLERVSQARGSSDHHHESEESQDYGEFPDLENDNEAPPPLTQESTAIEHLHDRIWHLVSNCFGSESVPEDRLLTAVVDTWAAVIQHSVHSQRHDWSAYIDAHGSFSWNQLPNTEQSQKYLPYWLSKLIDAGGNALFEYRPDLITAWLVSLCERESALKFQHFVTSALLNCYPDDALLQNMPFVRPLGANVVITASTLRERRLSVISTVLSNIRTMFEAMTHDAPGDLMSQKRIYTDLLKHVMATMKKTYQSLPQDTEHIRGVYVDFVQNVVEMLQQYTSEICPIDKFFTDSSAFPLPATDPTYVVGRLRGYALRLTDSKTLKQLAIFIQTVSERAAIDNQQAYLVGQLGMAMSNAFEHGDFTRPTLRGVLLQAVFPAYFDNAFRSAAGWVLAKPMLQASALVLSDLIYDFDVKCDASCRAVTDTIVVVFDTFIKSTEVLIDHSGLMEQSQTLHTLAMVFQVVTAALPVADYIVRCTQNIRIKQQAAYLGNLAMFVTATVSGHHDGTAPIVDDCGAPSICASNERRVTDIRTFCTSELSQAMSRWGVQGELYWFVRGSVRREVIVDLGTYEEEREELLAVLNEFETMVRRMESLRLESVARNKINSVGLEVDDLVI